MHLIPVTNPLERVNGEIKRRTDVVGIPRGLAAGKVELTSRRTGESEELSPEAAVARVGEIYAGVA